MQNDLKIVQSQQLSHLLAMLQILLWILFITYILGPLEPLPVVPTATSIPSAWYLPLNGHYLQGGYTAGLSFIEIFYSLHFHSGCIFRKIDLAVDVADRPIVVGHRAAGAVIAPRVGRGEEGVVAPRRKIVLVGIEEVDEDEERAVTLRSLPGQHIIHQARRRLPAEVPLSRTHQATQRAAELPSE